MINFIDQDGNKRSIPFIVCLKVACLGDAISLRTNCNFFQSKEFSLKMQCVTYFEPSFEELNSLSQMALHNWIINCRKYESMLSQLVSLPYFRFVIGSFVITSYSFYIFTFLDSGR